MNMINHIFRNVSFFDITLYQYGWEKCDPMHSYGPAVRNHYLIHFIIKGSGKLVVRSDQKRPDVTYNVHQGEAFLITPNIVNHYIADEAAPWEYFWIEFDGLKAKEYMDEAGLSMHSPIYTPIQRDERNSVKEYLGRIMDHPNAPTPEVMGYMYLFINGLIETSQTKKIMNPNNMKEFYIRETISFIEQNYMKDITIQHMANWCNLHRTYFSKLFKSATESSPQDFLIKYRMNKACEQLLTTEKSIGDIAVSVGYSNPLHFSRAFKKVMTLSPREWKGQNKE